ncbi:DUF4435 domain-containing protein [Acinetobacter guillouiae]|uniref:DUF4435 domain-containing protein n=1 Tax=Acinetobacter guillouiae TaxID=106649 RepID=A0A8X8GDU2_ACIGI|nr:DUF4435 domain-containing protein [Acinetobacter guillouiae]MCF0265469.1 DUF4435 domain-containing protein [Acinetobacter guillouiae]
MNEFINYFTNSEYIGAYNASKEGNLDAAKKGIVYIEDDTDQFFWETFVNTIFPDQYNVQASIIDRPGERGKRALEKLYQGANKKVLIAVDSDYDFICPNYKFGSHFYSNQFILHTFGFSRESALLEIKNLDYFFRNCKFTIQNNVDLISFISKFSNIAYNGLIQFTNEIINENKSNLTESDFSNCFNILSKKIVKDDLSLDESLLNIIENNINSLFSSINLPTEEFITAEERLKFLGINPNNAYRFICGHTVYDLIVKIHDQLKEMLFKLEFEKIKKDFVGEAIKERKRQLMSHFQSHFAIETICRSYPISHADEIHVKILDRISKL